MRIPLAYLKRGTVKVPPKSISPENVTRVNLVSYHIHRSHTMMLRQQSGHRKAHISCSCNCYFHYITNSLYPPVR